jgi:uncharacterized glyoxalase superfamily protein PhnB
MKITPELVVNDVKKAVNFYQSFLDFKLVDKVEVKNSYFWAKMESKDKSVEIMFSLLKNTIGEIPELKNRNNGGRMILLLEVNEIDRLYSAFMNTEFILKDLYKTDYGTTEFVVKDIDGYILNIVER